jgi:hypothetical protein
MNVYKNEQPDGALKREESKLFKPTWGPVASSGFEQRPRIGHFN